MKAGDFFDLGDGVKTKAPGMSGVAAHDCRCRCFLEYNLMTAEEFAKATGKTTEEVLKTLRKQEYSGIIKANNAKITDSLLFDIPDEKSKFTLKEIIEEMDTSIIGKKTIKNIENSNVLIRMDNSPKPFTHRGEQAGNEIIIYLSNIKNKRVVAQTIIHEMTHYYYNIGQCQHAEAVCFAMEKMHLVNRDYLTTDEWNQMIKLAVDNYPEFEWEVGGYGNFKQFDFVK